MAKSVTGTLYAIGVGPGSPDLLTLRAIKILSHIDVILAAASPKNDSSLALSIAQEFLHEDSTITRLNFPMTRDQKTLEASWKENAAITAQILESGKNAAFLTLGDPLVYSTFGYLMRTLKQNHPEVAIEVVPGITSFQAAAALTHTVLCESGEHLTVIPGINSEQEIQKALSQSDSVVILKTYRNSEAIYQALKQDDRCENVVFASRMGMKDEVIRKGLKNLPETPPYLSLLLVPSKR